MRSRAGQKARPRFFNGPPKTEIDKRYELLVVGEVLSILAHRDLAAGGRCYPCLGDTCKLCRDGSPEQYEYIGALINGHADRPVTWCVPPDWSHQLGEPSWKWVTFTTWLRRDGTVKIERSRKAPAVIDFPEIDVWQHCLQSWRLTEAQAGPRPAYDYPAAEPDILQLPKPEPLATREDWERLTKQHRKTGGA